MSDELTQFLRESEERYRTLVETASDAILTIDENSTIVFVNSAVERIFGYKTFELTGQSLSILMPEEMRERHYRGFARYLETGEKKMNWERVEIPARRRDGAIFTMEISFAESRYQNRPCFIGIARDITERKLVEQTLNESQMMLALAMRSSRIGAWEQDLATDTVNWSPELEEIFGLTKDSFGQTRASFHALVHQDDRARIRQQVNEAIAAGAEYQIEFRFHHADGSVRWMEGRGQAVYSESGEPIRVYGIGLDISARKFAEEALQKTEEQYRALFASIDEGFCVVEMIFDEHKKPTDYVFLEINPAFERQTGLLNREIKKGKTARQLIPGLEDFWFEIYGQVALTGEPARFTHGSEALGRWFDVYAFRTDELNSRKVAILFKDVTARQQAEAERERVLLREQNARQEAEAANRAKDEFLSVLSHELRTPLNAVLGWTRMMQTGSLNAQQTAQAIETIERNARLQNTLIEDLLDVSRIISGKMRIDSARVNLKEVIDSALEMIRPLAIAKDVALEFQTPAEIVEVSGDATRLQQIVVNLGNNAIKFTPSGGTVTLRLIKNHATAKIEVKDTGIGISDEFLPHIFDRFRQADSTTQRHHSGLGLGLTIVKHLTELHDGKVSAESGGENQGAVFRLEFPSYAETGEQSEADEATPVSADQISEDEFLSGKAFLLVDDDCDGMFPVKLFLEKRGADAVCMDSAAAALEKIAEQSFDFILSDIGMPDMDGYEFIDKVRALPNYQTVPAIALTAYASSEDRKRAVDAGFTTHLSKPLDFAKLLETIGSIIYQK